MKNVFDEVNGMARFAAQLGEFLEKQLADCDKSSMGSVLIGCGIGMMLSAGTPTERVRGIVDSCFAVDAIGKTVVPGGSA